MRDAELKFDQTKDPMFEFRIAAAFAALLLSSGCSFIMGSPPKALSTNPEPQETISPVLVYTSDCDFQKEIDGIGLIGARTTYPAAYAAEAVCKALNAQLPGAMDAVGVKAAFKLRKVDPKTARPLTMKEDAVVIGAKYVVAMGEPNGFGGYQQYGPSVGLHIRLYDAESGEYRGWAEADYSISLRDFSARGPAGEAQRIGADIANKLARTMLKRCTEAYPYQCQKVGTFRFAEPRDAYGK
ncbi:hypothetical protein ABE485_29050 [Achromobacter spanius]|uniref:hypothetical protein n=1 Tax=Achromobacter spanius TaxID=217203 RepID=UPI0032080DA4